MGRWGAESGRGGGGEEKEEVGLSPVRKWPWGLQSPFQIRAVMNTYGLAKKNRNSQEGHDLRICF